MKKIICLSLLAIITALNTFAQTPPARTWFHNDFGEKVSVKERWEENRKGQKDGIYIRYNSDGERFIYGRYEDGEMHGKWIVHSDEEKEVKYFKNGEANGKFKRIENGTVVRKGQYSNGKKSGYWKVEYNEKTGVYQKGRYISGKRDGKWKNTLPRGVKVFNNGKLNTYNKDKFLGEADTDYDNNLKDWAKDCLYGGILIQQKTKKGFTTIYDNGEVVKVLNQKGENLTKIAKEREAKRKAKKKRKKAFNSCSSIEEYKGFIRQYPESEYVEKAKEKINKLKIQSKNHNLQKHNKKAYNKVVKKYKETLIYNFKESLPFSKSLEGDLPYLLGCELPSHDSLKKMTKKYKQKTLNYDIKINMNLLHNSKYSCEYNIKPNRNTKFGLNHFSPSYLKFDDPIIIKGYKAKTMHANINDIKIGLTKGVCGIRVDDGEIECYHKFPDKGIKKKVLEKYEENGFNMSEGTWMIEYEVHKRMDKTYVNVRYSNWENAPTTFGEAVNKYWLWVALAGVVVLGVVSGGD